MEERHVTLCWPNHIDPATLSGGSWSADMPLDHLGTSIFAQVAESVDTALASTQFDATLGRFRPVGVVALANHNLSVSAEWRVRAWFDDAATDLAWDSSWAPVWPAVFSTEELEWEYDNWWSGTLGEQDRSAFTPLATMFLDAVQIVRRVTVEIDDISNVDGLVRIGRAMVADLWQPEYNAAYGVQYGHQIDTAFEVAGNADQTEYADPKTPKRTVAFALDHLSDQEGFRRALALQRLQGLHGEVLYTETRTADTLSFARTFIGRQVSVDPLAHPYFATYTNSISLQEIL